MSVVTPNREPATPMLSQPDTASCEICGKPDAPLHVEFDGYACEECQASWTEKSEAPE